MSLVFFSFFHFLFLAQKMTSCLLLLGRMPAALISLRPSRPRKVFASRCCILVLRVCLPRRRRVRRHRTRRLRLRRRPLRLRPLLQLLRRLLLRLRLSPHLLLLLRRLFFPVTPALVEDGVPQKRKRPRVVPDLTSCLDLIADSIAGAMLACSEMVP